jgi:hypothetical protein
LTPINAADAALLSSVRDIDAAAEQGKERGMRLADIDKVNHLVAALADINGLIGTAETAEVATYQLLIEAPGDASFKMSAEGASTSHSRGTEVSAGFLTSLKELAVAELHARREIVLKDLGALGVDTVPG